MLPSGNSSVAACARCLMSAVQREIPFARSKGIDPDVYDVPFEDVRPSLDETARDTLAVYERRVSVEDTELQFYQETGDDGTFVTVTLADSDGDIIDEDEGDDE